MPIKPPKIKKYNRVIRPGPWKSPGESACPPPPGWDLGPGSGRLQDTMPRSCLAFFEPLPPADSSVLDPLGDFVFQLQSHQKEGIIWALSQPKTMLNHRTGTGKTWTLACIAYLHMAKGESRVLMVAPPSAAYYQFCGEVQTLFNKLKDPPPIYMSEDKNHRDYPDRGVVIVPWSILADAVDALLEWAPGVLLLDESHRASVCRGLWVRAFLTPGKPEEWCLTSSQSGAALALGYATPRATLATATPTSTGRLNWHTQLSILEPRGWGTAMEFGYYFCEGRKAEAWGKQGDGSQASWAWEANGTSNDEVFFPRVKRLVHTVMTQDMSIPLPPLTFRVVDLGREELNLPANAPGVLPNNKAGTVLHAELCDAAERKTDYIIREVRALISMGVRKIAVVTGRKEHVNELKKKLATLGLPIFHYVGSKTAESLKKPMKYQLASEGIFLTTFQAGGESLNLHSTEHVLCSMCPWDTRSLIQLLGRFQRINGVHATFNLIMARGTKDDRIRQVLLPRILEVLELGQDSIVGDIKEGIQVSPEEENKMLSDILLEDTDWR